MASSSSSSSAAQIREDALVALQLHIVENGGEQVPLRTLLQATGGLFTGDTSAAASSALARELIDEDLSVVHGPAVVVQVARRIDRMFLNDDDDDDDKNCNGNNGSNVQQQGSSSATSGSGKNNNNNNNNNNGNNGNSVQQQGSSSATTSGSGGNNNNNNNSDARQLSAINRDVMQTASTARPFDCPICFDTIPALVGWACNRTCNHRICKPCARRHLSVTALEKPVYPLRCPVCSGAMDDAKCIDLIQGTGRACEALQKLVIERGHMQNTRYCAHRECNTPFEWVDDARLDGVANRFKVECPLCKRFSCVDCCVPWHDGLTCEQFRQGVRPRNNNNNHQGNGRANQQQQQQQQQQQKERVVVRRGIQLPRIFFHSTNQGPAAGRSQSTAARSSRSAATGSSRSAAAPSQQRNVLVSQEEQERINDQLMHDMAARKKWTSCPTCKAIVDRKKTDCYYVKCRCGTGFCHKCGTKYRSSIERPWNCHGDAGCSCGLFNL